MTESAGDRMGNQRSLFPAISSPGWADTHIGGTAGI